MIKNQMDFQVLNTAALLLENMTAPQQLAAADLQRIQPRQKNQLHVNKNQAMILHTYSMIQVLFWSRSTNQALQSKYKSTCRTKTHIRTLIGMDYTDYHRKNPKLKQLNCMQRNPKQTINCMQTKTKASYRTHTRWLGLPSEVDQATTHNNQNTKQHAKQKPTSEQQSNKIRGIKQ